MASPRVLGHGVKIIAGKEKEPEKEKEKASSSAPKAGNSLFEVAEGIRAKLLIK